MCLRLVISSIVLAALAANPCSAKDGHAQHGTRASAAHNGGKATSASGKGASGVSPTPSKAAVPIDAETIVARPVLPPRGVTQRQIRIVNPSVKTANPRNSSRNQAGEMTITAPVVRKAIGQPVVSPKISAGAQRPILALQKPAAVSPRTGYVGPAALPVSSGATRMSVANSMNRSDLNGATVIRPPTGSVGGPAQARYDISGTSVQGKH